MIFADEVKITKNENSIEYNIVCHDYVDYIFPIYSRNLYPIKCTVEIYDENKKFYKQCKKHTGLNNVKKEIKYSYIW